MNAQTERIGLLGRRTLAAMALAGLMAPMAVSAGTITGSVHDFRGEGWAVASGQEICAVCHTPHNAIEAAIGPLWDRTTSDPATFTVYTSPTDTLNNAAGQPNTVSLMCLSCHDGTIALDAYGGAAGTAGNEIGALYGPSVDFGTDLSDDHPISLEYGDAGSANPDPGINDRATAATIGEGADLVVGTIDTAMLIAGQVECSSCHDVHNKTALAGTKLLKQTMTGSALCLTCHDK